LVIFLFTAGAFSQTDPILQLYLFLIKFNYFIDELGRFGVRFEDVFSHNLMKSGRSCYAR